MQADFEEL